MQVVITDTVTPTKKMTKKKEMNVNLFILWCIAESGMIFSAVNGFLFIHHQVHMTYWYKIYCHV